MSDAEQTEPNDADTGAQHPGHRVFSVYGLVSAALGVLAVAAVGLGGVITSMHRTESNERAYQTRILQAAVDWTDSLVNMNTDNVDATLRQLHDGTVGQLNVEFDAAVQPYRDVVRRLQSRSTGRIEAVAIESVHHDPDAESGRSRARREPLPAEFAARTDTVLVVATSVADNAGGKPATVHWNLRLDVSDVGGKPKISGLETIR